MKFHKILLGVTFGIAACSPPKYAYHFDHYDYNSGRKPSAEANTIIADEKPLELDENTLVGSANPETVVIAEKKETAVFSREEIVEKYRSMSKAEQKAFKKELTKELKSYAKISTKKKVEGVESVEATKKFDTLVTLAIVFGVAGVVMITLAGVSNGFWIAGAIALAIGAFFFVKWVANGNG